MRRSTPQNTRQAAGVFFCVLLLSACSTSPQWKKLVSPSSAPLPVAVELTDTPFFPQQDYQCGPAALATVLNRFNVTVAPKELVPQIYLPARKGSLQIEIAATARRYGMLAYLMRPELSDLLTEISAGNPVLVLQNLAFDWLPRWHYAVVIGYDLSRRELVLRSGTRRRWLTTLAAFERTWTKANYWALAIVPADRIPKTAEPLRYLKAAHDLEKTGQLREAFTAYRAATGRWPNRAQTWLALGNTAYRLRKDKAAVVAFEKATTLEPDDPRGWNNFAYALLQQGCPEQARVATACAAALAPGDANVQNSREEIDKKARGRDETEAGCGSVKCPR